MKYLFIYICCLFSVLSIAQKPFITLEIEPNEIIAGETMTLSVRTNIQGNIDIDLPNVFEEGYDVMNGMEQQVDYTTGRIMTLVYRTQTGTISKAGTYKIGPATVKKGYKSYSSNSVTVKVLKNKISVNPKENISSRQLNQPGFGVIEQSKNTVYEGEALVLNAKVYSRFNPSHLEDYFTYSMDGIIDAHDISNSSRIMVKEESFKGQRYYAFEYDKKVVFPSGAGNLKIQPFELILRNGFEGLPITSSKSTVKVKPLPANAPDNFIGAVGKIELNTAINTKTLKQGDVFTVKLEIEGYGNLHLIDAPALEIPSAFSLYGDPSVEEDFKFGVKGAEGKISYIYNIQVLESGKLTLPATKISYFDIQKERYIELICPAKTIAVDPNEEYTAANTLKAQGKQKKGSTNQLFQKNSTKITRKDSNTPAPFMFWIAIVLPLIIATALLIYFKKIKAPSVKPAAQSAKINQPTFDAVSYIHEIELALESSSDQEFCTRIDQIIRKATNHKFGLMPDMQLSKTEIVHQLGERGMNDSAIHILNQLLSTCEEARYGMNVENLERGKIAEQAKLWLQSLNSHIV